MDYHLIVDSLESMENEVEVLESMTKNQEAVNDQAIETIPTTTSYEERNQILSDILNLAKLNGVTVRNAIKASPLRRCVYIKLNISYAIYRSI